VTASVPEHLRALEHANRTRLARAEAKRRIAAGDVSAAEIVANPPWYAESMSVSELLMSQRRWGRARCRRLLLSLGVPENKRLGTLSARQRAALAQTLNGGRSQRQAGEAPAATSETRATLEQLEAVVADHQRALAAASRLSAERDRLVREASRHGLSRSFVASVAGLTAGRIQQIVANADASSG
jgi:hypothetical protein